MLLSLFEHFLPPAAVIMQHAAQPIAAVTMAIGGMLVGNGNSAAFSFGTV